MKAILSFLSVFLLFLFFQSCGSSKSTQQEDKTSGGFKEINDPLLSLTEEANKIIDDGGIAAVGQGLSRRQDLAKEKARANADGALAEIFNKKVDRLKKSFQEEVGQGRESEVNELFSNVTKIFTSKVLTGAVEKNSKLLQNEKGEYMYGVLMSITPKAVNMSIMDEMENGKPQLYQRFRSSQAFDELKKEIENYEKKESMESSISK